MQPKINCPQCGETIDVNDLVFQQVSGEIKEEYSRKALAERKILEAEIRKSVSDEKEQELLVYREELKQKVEQVKNLNRTKAELEKLKREKEELRSTIEAEAQVTVTETLNKERTKILLEIEEKNKMKLAEREHIIEQLKIQLKDAQRRVEQGSMQLQGEVQELAIESWLEKMFPLDSIEEVKKGAKGADCIQVVNTRLYSNCGRIYYESKRTKDFQNSWIEKFKDDMRLAGAQFGILVTDVYPKGHDRVLQMEGIWICSMSEFKGLSQVVRETVILIHELSLTQENKGDKMTLLYNYLVGSEFKHQIQAIVESFSIMSEDLNAERRAMETLWKKRQKQIDKVLLNTSHMYATIKGIAGPAVATIDVLELTQGK